MPLSLAKRALVVGLAVSLCTHLLCALLLFWFTPGGRGDGGDGAIVIEFDIHEAPEAPAADMPADDPEAPMDDSSTDPDSDSAEEQATDPAQDDTVPIPPETDPEADEAIAAASIDAGVPDAATVADNTTWDAGPIDAQAVASLDPEPSGSSATHDAGVPIDARVAEVASAGDAGLDVDRDAGQTEVASSGTGVFGEADDIDEPPDSDTADELPSLATRTSELEIGLAPTLIASTTPKTDTGTDTPGAGAGSPGSGGPKRTPSQANLLAYMPKGELITALIRFDRLHGTEWSQRTADILAPMPDSRALLGSRKVAISDLFRTLVISSPSPRDVTQTTVIGHTDMNRRETRTFLNHPEARVNWAAVRGGALGTRRRSRLIAPHDKRTFLIPYPGWVVLTQKRNLGALSKPATGDLDTLTAAPADLQPWLAAVRHIEQESGPETGPAVIVTIARMLPETWEAPYVGPVVGAIPTPERATLALEVTDKGFFVRGTLIFKSADAAGDFVAKAEQAQKNFVETITGRALLSQIKAYNAVRGLSFAQNKEKVGYATSISVADARAVMDFAALQTRTFFGGPWRRPAGNRPAGKKSDAKKPGK